MSYSKVDFGRTLYMGWAALVLFLTALGCGPNRQSSPQTGGRQAVRQYTKQDLEKLISIGMESNKLVDVLGSPAHEEAMGANSVRLRFIFPLDEKEGVSVGGVVAEMKNGNVERWHTIISETRITGKATKMANSRTLQLHLPSERVNQLIKLYDVRGCISISGESILPALVFEANVYGGREENFSPVVTNCILVINDAEALRINQLLTTASGQRVLITSSNRIFAVPLVEGPVSNRMWRFTIIDDSILD